MKRFFTYFVLFLMTTGVYAQQSNNIVINGQIVDSLSEKAIAYATVIVLNEKQLSVPVKVAVTNENGYFRIELKVSGKYFLKMEFMGKKSLFVPVTLENEQILDMGKIFMLDDIQELKTINVTAQKQMVKVDLDKITYRIEEDPDSKTNNVLEMLKKVPMVSVDGEENIQVKGSSNFKFYINNKPSNMLSNNPKDVLRSIPANTVKNIEVITEPGAKYDAEGVAGIINIVMQSQSLLGGYIVSLSAMGNTLGRAVGGVYFSVKYGKIGLTGNFNYAGFQNIETEYSIMRENYNNVDNHFLYQNGSGKSGGNMSVGYSELSYEINNKNLINLNFTDRGSSIKTDQFSDIMMKTINKNDAFHYEQSSDAKISQTGIILGSDYQRTFKQKDRMLTASYKLDLYNNDNDVLSQINPLLNFNANRNRQFNFADSREHTFQLDYTTPIATIHTVEAGLKYIKRINKSNSGLSMFLNDWIDLASDNDKFLHLQDIWAAYAGYGLKFEKWGLKTGVRYEGTRLNAEYPINTTRNFAADYSDLIPSITVSFMPKPGHSFRGGYNLRIQRPGISYLNPYVNTTDTSNIRYGNPELDAVKYHNFNLNYNLYKPKFTMNANLSYSFTDKGISEFTWIDGYVSKTSYFNILQEDRWNCALYLNWTPVTKLRIYSNMSGTFGKFRSNRDESLENKGIWANISGGVQYYLPKNFVLNFDGFASTPTISLQGEGISYHYYSLSASKSMLKQKLNIRAALTNLFARNLNIKQTSQSVDFHQSTTITQPLRSVSISVSYRFGEMKSQIKKAQRTIKNEDQIQNENSGVSGTVISQGN